MDARPLTRAEKKAAHWQRKKAKQSETAPGGQQAKFAKVEDESWQDYGEAGTSNQYDYEQQDDDNNNQQSAEDLEAQRAAKKEAKRLAKLARREARKAAGIEAEQPQPKEEVDPEAAAAEKAARKAAKRAAQKEKREQLVTQRAQKLFGHLGLKGGQEAVVTPAKACEHPFVVDPLDHAETPFEAYRDIEPLLFRLATTLGTTKEKLRIYDPYYCEGSMKAHLARLGFMTVHNENVDFYEVVKKRKVPEYDVLVTNPPFSGDHMMRILQFCASTSKPWLLLMPAFVSGKPYYKRFLEELPAPEAAPHFIVPNAKYTFTAPSRTANDELMHEASRVKATADLDRPFTIFASKFGCVWFIQLEQYAEAILPWWRKRIAGAARCRLVSELGEMRELVADPKVNVPKPWRKKLNRQRKAELRRQE